jgi:hypothetical protein
MEHIIHQITVDYVKKTVDMIQETGISNISGFMEQLHTISKLMTVAITSEILHQMDIALVAANKERKADRLRIKERDVPRTLLTSLGELQYKRTYFENENGKRCYLLDHLIGVEPYERLSRDLCAALVQAAAEVSMEQSATQLGVPVSRQTVNNNMFRLREVVVDAQPASVTPRELHLFADEDHVHMKNGQNAIVPLVTVTEGIDTSKKRHKTINPIHFEGSNMDNQSFFEGVSSFLYNRYDMQHVDNIYVHSDAGKWIKAARDWLPNVRFIMDGFHLEKRFRQISPLPGAIARMRAIRKAIREDDLSCFLSQCKSISENLLASDRDKLNEHICFIQNHWDAIVLRLQDTVCGSCTEPMLSHVLSKRLSRSPLAWSEQGLRQMAMLRVYVKNGGLVTANDICAPKSRTRPRLKSTAHRQGYEKYRMLADNQISDFLSSKLDWSIFSQPSLASGKLDAFGVLKKAHASRRDFLASA